MSNDSFDFPFPPTNPFSEDQHPDNSHQLDSNLTDSHLTDSDSNDLLNKIITFFPKKEINLAYHNLSCLGVKPSISTLFKAVKKSNYDLVKSILEDPISEEWNLNQRLAEENDLTLVEMAADNIGNNSESHYIDILELLLKKGVDPNNTITQNIKNEHGFIKTTVVSAFISLTLFDREVTMPFGTSIWTSLDLLVKYGLNFTKIVYKKTTLFQYWVEAFLQNKRNWDFSEINDFFRILDIIISAGQKFEFCQLTEGLVKSLHRDLKNDSRWYPHLMKLFEKFQIVTTENKITNDNYLCLVCRENPRNRVFIPCNHLATCDDCYHKVKKEKTCPACRAIIREVMDIYLP